MEKLKKWLGRRGFEVELAPGARDSVDFEEKTVTINSRCSYQIRLASLIHECGHVGIFASRLRAPQARVCGSTLGEALESKGRGDLRGRASRISLLHEEIEAWEVGESLARRLKVRYVRKVLEKDRVRALMSYIKFAACRMRSSKNEHALSKKGPPPPPSKSKSVRKPRPSLGGSRKAC